MTTKLEKRVADLEKMLATLEKRVTALEDIVGDLCMVNNKGLVKLAWEREDLEKKMDAKLAKKKPKAKARKRK